MKAKTAVQVLGWIGVSELAGVVGSVFSVTAIQTWYGTLSQPAFSPPNWVFGPVWTTLYALMGIAAFLVWQKGSQRQDVKIALRLFFMQLGLNAIWSIIFFGLHSIGGGLVEICMLWIAVLATTLAFAKISQPAAWLLVPYLAWVSFAAILNLCLWRLN